MWQKFIFIFPDYYRELKTGSPVKFSKKVMQMLIFLNWNSLIYCITSGQRIRVFFFEQLLGAEL